MPIVIMPQFGRLLLSSSGWQNTLAAVGIGAIYLGFIVSVAMSINSTALRSL